MPPADPSLSLAQRIDAVCDRFEADWKAGRRQPLEAYLAEVAASEQEAFRSALLAVQRELDTHSRSVDSSVVQEDSQRTTGYTPTPETNIPKAIGRFEILALLGEGAFGKVYKARDPQLDREVAIKVPKLEAFAGKFDLQRFLREAKSAAAVRHPNICPVHEVNAEGDQPYIVMAFIPGKSLAEYLKGRTKPLPPKQAALIVRKLALALQAAHEKGIVHRDLKPANILFDPQRKDVVITDFGLAVRTTGDVRQTQSGMLMGTPAYMSPEQARGDVKQVGPASDIFALGVILYELLTGSRPFKGSIGEVIGQIQHVDPPSIRALNPDVDERLETICRQALDKQPRDRFPSMKALAAALDAYLKDQPASTTATPQPKPADSEQSIGLAQVMAALSADRRAETEAVIEAAVRRAQLPRRVLVLLALFFVGGLTALAGIIFYTRTPTATVMIHIDVDLNDKTLSFFLDGKQVPAEKLQAPMELKVGTHELLVKRGEEVIRKFTFVVSPDAGPRIELREEKPKKDSAPTGPVWTSLIQSADELIEGETRSRNTETSSVEFVNGTLVLKGAGAKFFPKFSAKNYILRANVMSLNESLVLTVRRTKGGGYHGVFHNVERGRDWATCGIGEGENVVWWGGLAGSWQRVVEQFPAEFAISVFEEEIALYVNGERVCVAMASEVTPGGVMIGSKLNYRASLRDVAVCVLDGTKLTPNDIYPQQLDKATEHLLSPNFLSDSLKKNNLLKNPGFEQGEENWRSHSGGKKRTSIVNTPVHSGTQALRISADWWDSARAIQTVSVKPNRRYLFSGWIKTQNIRFYERDKSGAHLFVAGGYRHRSVNVPVTADWTYYAVIFHSGDEQEVRVHAAFGHFGGTVMGTAWFDDLCLIELPEEQAVQADLDRWQGTWRCVAEHSRGKALTAEELKQRGTLMRIEGNRRQVERTLDGRFSQYAGSFKLNPAVSPKEFDYEDDVLKGVKNLHRGVYEFNGTRLRLIYRHAQGTVPQRATWQDKGQPNVVWFEFERVDPKQSAKQTTLEDEDRKFAEWLLSIGAGRVTVSVDGQPLQHIIKAKGDSLPAGALRVHHFDIWGNKQVNDDTVEPILKWIERRNVATEFGFHATNIGDETVRRLTALPCVKKISVGGTRVTRACIPHLAKRPDLEELYLSSVPIIDDDLEQLAGLTQLKALNIAGSQITDAGMKHLKGMRALRDLELDSTMLSGACLDDLTGLPIQYLNLNKTKVRGRDALSKLSKLTELKDVRLEGLFITDDDLNGLIECRSVEKIWLRDNRITDKGLEILAQMKWLRELGLAYDNPEIAITPAGVERLRKAMPNCNLVFEPAK
jgi:uncharacterized protein (TIGR03067 family)